MEVTTRASELDVLGGGLSGLPVDWLMGLPFRGCCYWRQDTGGWLDGRDRDRGSPRFLAGKAQCCLLR